MRNFQFQSLFCCSGVVEELESDSSIFTSLFTLLFTYLLVHGILFGVF